ncbi:hypothetical protein WMF18_06075 [Sorangium sp. So ce315]|uniref:hypothetical protein n=1 Tax=Sorangium sp. So ce315 TaxID=3133299 RepID=UPI003F5D81A9
MLSAEEADVDASPPLDAGSPTDPSQPSSIMAGNARCRRPRIHRGPTNNLVVTSWLIVFSRGSARPARLASSKGGKEAIGKAKPPR